MRAVGGNRIIFVADNSVSGDELWSSDGTEAGTFLLKDIHKGWIGSSPDRFATLGDGRVVFSAYNPRWGDELWITDGTQAGTRLVKDIFPGGTNSYIGGYNVDPITPTRDGRVVFQAWSPDRGMEPWISDGTRKGTRLLKDFTRGPESSSVVFYRFD